MATLHLDYKTGMSEWREHFHKEQDLYISQLCSKEKNTMTFFRYAPLSTCMPPYDIYEYEVVKDLWKRIWATRFAQLPMILNDSWVVNFRRPAHCMDIYEMAA